MAIIKSKHKRTTGTLGWGNSSRPKHWIKTNSKWDSGPNRRGQKQSQTVQMGSWYYHIPLQTHPSLCPDPHSITSQILVTNKHALEMACLDEAHQWFTQVAFTPILWLDTDHGFTNLSTGSQAFHQILDRTYSSGTILDPYTQKLLSHLGRPLGIAEHPSQTDAEYNQRWHQAQETTASSPSGLH